MSGEEIFGLIIMLSCCGGCGALFYGIGVWASRSEKPVHFWAGSTVDPKTVRDIPGYNRACARMWKRFSVPFWIAALVALLGVWGIKLSSLGAVFVTLACTLGLWWLVRTYRKIETDYIERRNSR